VKDGVDSHTGLPAISLYGEHHAPTPEQLKQLDALVFDIQDVGCRFYTFTTTLGMCMEAANAAGLKFFVLDRVNPINGLMMDGPVRGGPSSFVAWYPEPVRYGLTEGELATMCKAERQWDKLDLTVIKLQGWDRAMWFDQTGLPWINPSPNMRSLTEAMLYPGVGLLENCHISVGRGTGTPFEVIGAPYIDDLRLAGGHERGGPAGRALCARSIHAFGLHFQKRAVRRRQYHFNRPRTLPGGGYRPAGGEDSPPLASRSISGAQNANAVGG
jgi:uncharacterized protein YbbC (DUF1343 family)